MDSDTFSSTSQRNARKDMLCIQRFWSLDQIKLARRKTLCFGPWLYLQREKHAEQQNFPRIHSLCVAKSKHKVQNFTVA